MASNGKNAVKSSDFLVGRYLVSFTEPGRLNWQGAILAERDGYVLVQLFSWVVGETTDQVLMPTGRLAEVFDGNIHEPRFLLYSDRDDFIFALEHRLQPRSTALREKAERELVDS